MKSVFPWLGLGWFALVGGALLASCGSEEVTTGGTKQDAGTGGSDARADGSPDSATVVMNAKLGHTCTARTKDTDCGPGLICVESTSGLFSGGGPAGGLCTAPCTKDSDCRSAGALCKSYDDTNGYCFEGCLWGAGGGQCHDRPEMACNPFEVQSTSCAVDDDCERNEVCSQRVCARLAGACMPQCNDDQECPAGFHCDLGTFFGSSHGVGVCTDKPLEGLPTGAICDLNALTDPCRGQCLGNTGDTQGICYDGCTVGATVACGWDMTGPAPAACVTLYRNTGAGDVGGCLQLCDCNADCGGTGVICAPLVESDQQFTERAGSCQMPFDVTHIGLVDCAAGGAAGAGGMTAAATGGSGGTGGSGTGGTGG
ncbi:MAG TPA: hypothetical protein VGJ84_06240 [Polyangiaceae bacterium]|jgi:hypothetical protein